MSALRALCPGCRTRTAVALDGGYECHVCGTEFAAGVVRVPRAWGNGGEAMARAARLALPFPEVATVECATLDLQTEMLAAVLPRRSIILGGCCCAHTAAILGLAQRVGRLGVVWLDAHGDLNTPESSTSGNAWGMPLRAAIESGAVAPADVALTGVRNLDAPEVEYLAATGIDGDLDRALAGVDAAYIAFDADVLDERAVSCFMPEEGGLEVAEVESIVRETTSRRPLAGIGLTGLTEDPSNTAVLLRVLAAAGLTTAEPGPRRAPV